MSGNPYPYSENSPFGYEDLNEVMSCGAEKTSAPGQYECRVFPNETPPKWKIYIGSSWYEITVAHLCVRRDTNDTLAGTYTYSKTSGAIIAYSDGYISVNDSHGDFNIYSGVTTDYKSVSGGGSQIKMSKTTSGITLQMTAVAAGQTFNPDHYLTLDTAGLTVKNTASGGTLRDSLVIAVNSKTFTTANIVNSNPYSGKVIAVDGVFTIPEIPRGKVGFLIIKTTTTSKSVVYFLSGSSVTDVSKISGDAIFNTSWDNPGTLNVRFGSSYIEIQNKTAVSHSVTVGLFGI